MLHGSPANHSRPRFGHLVPRSSHINAMMNLCKLLVSKNSDILVTFVVTEEWLGFLGSEPKTDNIQFGSIPNVIPSEVGRAKDMTSFIEDVMTKMEEPFERLVDRLESLPTIIIYDTLLFWVVGIGNRRHIPVASFWPMAASFFSVFQHYSVFEQNGDYPINLLGKSTCLFLSSSDFSFYSKLSFILCTISKT